MRIDSSAVFVLIALHASAVCLLGCGSADDTEHSPAAVSTAEPYTCEAAQSLILDRKGTSPTTYDELIKYPRECRGPLYSILPPAVQSSLWKEHFERYVRARPSLTPEQQAVIERAKELLSPELYAIPPDAPEWREKVDAPIRELGEEAIKQFGELEAALLLGQIGPVLIVAQR